MSSIDDLEAFLSKWRESAYTFQQKISDAVEKAGYAFDSYGPEIEEDEGPAARWFMHVWQPNRPDEFADLDMQIYFDIISQEPDFDHYLPILDIMNNEGSITDDVRLSEDALRLDDDAGWQKVWAKAELAAQNIVDFAEAYNPKPTKRIWRIRGTRPWGAPMHPSLHTTPEIAKSEISERLRAIIDQASKVFWDLEAQRHYFPPQRVPSELMNIRIMLDGGTPLKALRRYHDLLGELDGHILDYVNGAAGTLDVQVLGGNYLEEVDW